MVGGDRLGHRFPVGSVVKNLTCSAGNAGLTRG